MPTREQTQALAHLRERQTIDRILWPDGADSPRFVYGQLSPVSRLSPQRIVDAFLARHGAIYGLARAGAAREYRLLFVRQDGAGNRHVELERTAGEYRIAPSRMSVWIDATGVIRRIKAHWPLVSSPKQPKVAVDAERALIAAAAARKRARLQGFAAKPTLEYRMVPARGKRRMSTLELAWNFVARFAGVGPATEGFVVSAQTGAVLLRYPDEDEVAATASGIGVNDADETAATPVRTIDVDDPGAGALTLLDSSRAPSIETRDMATGTSTTAAYTLCADDDGNGAFDDIANAPRSSSNRPEVDAHYNTGLIADYYARAVTVNAISLFGRVGWNDNAAQPWINLVHYGVDSTSSAFTRTDRLTYHGDGDGVNLTYKPTLDTCTHEWAHGVQMTEVTGGINPSGGFDGTAGENFVLKEAIADMVATSLARDSGWRMGAVFEDDAAMAGATHASTGSRLRGMQHPSDFGQPDHYYASADTSGLGYAGTASDYTRNGILDKAAYLVAMGGTHPDAASDPATYPPIAVYGIGVTEFENVLDYALNNLCGPADLFLDFRQDMIDAAEILYPGACESSTVAHAFDAVGVYESGTTPPPRPAGPDPMITPWGKTIDVPPYWQTPDIYVKDAADNAAAPLKGQVNRLFALVSNIGDADAIGVSVSFAFAPYGAGTSNNTNEAIDTVIVDVPTGGSIEVEVAWDLTDLTDDNGGTWPLPLGDFDHFCVKVDLVFATDADPCNNSAQNNFSNVVDADGDSDGETRFVIGNPAPEPQWVAVAQDGRWPRDWEVELDLTGAVRNRTRALQALTRSQAGARPPWIGEGRDAVVLPMLGNELVAAKLRWRPKARARYDGPVDGCVEAQATGQHAGRLTASMRMLRLRGGGFEAEVRGHLRSGKGATAVLRGTLTGRVDRGSGAFSGEFKGVARRKGEPRATTFKLKGRIAAMATLSAVVQSNGDVQGLALGVPLVGRVGDSCGTGRRHKGPRKTAAGI